MENENYKGINPAPDDQLQNNSQHPAEEDMDEDTAATERLTSEEPTKVVFLSANSEYTRKNGDAKVDIENVQRSVGMGKEELMKYANEPFWVRLRMSLFILFWLVWIAMLIGSIAIIVVVPGCPAAPRLQWWQKTVVYQVLVGSFKDSDGNGKGDLPGLSSKLDYFSELKVDTLLLSPIFASPGPDSPNEVTNFTDIAQHYGTLTDFKDFVAKADEKGMNLILEFIPNHSSDKHPWFIKSANGEDPFTDYYIWRDAKPGTGSPGQPPNNWVSMEGGAAWTWSPQRKKYYFHQFRSGQPDLNLRDPNLREEMKTILRFWLDEGVDGFKVKDVDFLFEDKAFLDEQSATGSDASAGGSMSEYDSLSHTYTRGQAENIELLREWRDMLVNYTDTTNSHPRILLVESPSKQEAYYGHPDDPLVDIPYNLELTSLSQDSTPTDLFAAFQNSFNSTPRGLWPNWVLGSSRQVRLLSRVGPSLLNGLHMVTLLSKGTPIVFFGDELGMEGGAQLKEGQEDDVESEHSAPMQWDNSTAIAAGNKASVNVKAELQESHSHLSIFRQLLALREKPVIGFGIMEFPLVDEQIFSMMRVKKGTPGYLVVINFSNNGTEVDFSKASKLLPETANVELATPVEGFLEDATHPKVTLSGVKLGPYQSAVLTFVPKDK